MFTFNCIKRLNNDSLNTPKSLSIKQAEMLIDNTYMFCG